jgi:hypothetical protein
VYVDKSVLVMLRSMVLTKLFLRLLHPMLLVVVVTGNADILGFDDHS